MREGGGSPGQGCRDGAQQHGSVRRGGMWACVNTGARRDNQGGRGMACQGQEGVSWVFVGWRCVWEVGVMTRLL